MDMLPAGDNDFDSDVEADIDVGEIADVAETDISIGVSLSIKNESAAAAGATQPTDTATITTTTKKNTNTSDMRAISHQLQHLTPPDSTGARGKEGSTALIQAASDAVQPARGRKKRPAPTGGKSPLGTDRSVGILENQPTTHVGEDSTRSARGGAADIGAPTPAGGSGSSRAVRSVERPAEDRETGATSPGEAADIRTVGSAEKCAESGRQENGGEGTGEAEGMDIDVGGSDSEGEGVDAVSLRTAADIKEDALFCLGDFHFTAEETVRMARRYPALSTLRPDYAVPLLTWLTEELDMRLKDMRNLVMRHPRLIAYRVKSHVEPKTKWLSERLGLGPAQLRKLVLTYPAVLSRSVESNLEPKIKWLEERLGATPSEVEVLIKRFPMIFGYSTSKNLEPTITFFTGEMSGNLEEVKATIMSCPAILSRSLDKRIMPRANLMRARKIIPHFGAHKWVVTTYTDAQFTKWLDGIKRRSPGKSEGVGAKGGLGGVGPGMKKRPAEKSSAKEPRRQTRTRTMISFAELSREGSPVNSPVNSAQVSVSAENSLINVEDVSENLGERPDMEVPISEIVGVNVA